MRVRGCVIGPHLMILFGVVPLPGRVNVGVHDPVLVLYGHLACLCQCLLCLVGGPDGALVLRLGFVAARVVLLLHARVQQLRCAPLVVHRRVQRGPTGEESHCAAAALPTS